MEMTQILKNNVFVGGLNAWQMANCNSCKAIKKGFKSFDGPEKMDNEYTVVLFKGTMLQFR